VAVTSLGAFELVDEVSEDEMAVTRHRVRPPCLGPEEFHTYFNSEGVLVDDAAFRERVFYSGEGGGNGAVSDRLANCKLRPCIIGPELAGSMGFDSCTR
jgi:hypothetical protein